MPERIRLPKGGIKTADIIYMHWILLTSLESRIRDPKKEVLDANVVEAGYRQLNAIGYTTAKPFWLK
jgi:hypothetical protein